MATQTTNYHLIKPEYGDPADINVLNGNMDALDSELKLQSDHIDEVEEEFHTFKPSGNGTADQILRSNGDGTTRWDNAATQQEVGAAVTAWLDANIDTEHTVVVDPTLSVEHAAADAKKTGDKITDLKSALLNITDNEEITGWTIGRYYLTNTSPIAHPIDSTDNTKTINNPLNRCVSIPCSEGDVFTLSLVGANAARAWCFAASDGTVIEVSEANALVTNLVIEAPEGADYLVLNDKRNTSSDTFTNLCFKGVWVAEQLDRIEQAIKETSEFDGQTVSVTFSTASQNIDTDIYLKAGVKYWFKSSAVTKSLIVYPRFEESTYTTIDGNGWYSLTPTEGGYLRVFNQSSGHVGAVTIYILTDVAHQTYLLNTLADNRYLRANKQYNSRTAWLNDYPSDRLSDIPLNQVICIGSSSVSPSDAPDSFAGNVITVSANQVLEPGAMQYAANLMDNGAILYRRYVYNANGNYWGNWVKAEVAEEEYHVGATREHTSFTSLLLDLAGNQRKKVIYIDGGTYDVYAEYMTEVSAGRLTVPPDTVESGDYFGTYNAFVPNNTRIVGLGNVVLQFTPTASQITYGASRTWSPLNIYGNVEIENVTVEAHNCRYAMHNDDHNTYPNARQHFKNVRFHYQKGDTKDNQELGFGHCIGFGIDKGSMHIFDDCEMTNTGGNGYCVYYGHESSTGNDGSLILRNCRIQSASFGNTCTVRLQTLARNTTGKVTALFENCYINGGVELNPFYTDSVQSFEVTLVQSNKVPVTRRNSQGGTIVDPYTLKWINPLATPTAQAPLIETDSYSG